MRCVFTHLKSGWQATPFIHAAPLLHIGKKVQKNRSVFFTIFLLHFWIELVVLIGRDLLISKWHLKMKSESIYSFKVRNFGYRTK
jgi:hypothetical protein